MWSFQAEEVSSEILTKTGLAAKARLEKENPVIHNSITYFADAHMQNVWRNPVQKHLTKILDLALIFEKIKLWFRNFLLFVLDQISLNRFVSSYLIRKHFHCSNLKKIPEHIRSNFGKTWTPYKIKQKKSRLIKLHNPTDIKMAAGAASLPNRWEKECIIEIDGIYLPPTYHDAFFCIQQKHYT